jgi:hypothetical protein
MTYVFACPKCKETKELDMKIVEYEKMKEALDFPLCKCGIRMDRVYLIKRLYLYSDLMEKTNDLLY